MADTRHHLQALDMREEEKEVIVLQAEATLDPRETAWRIEFLLSNTKYICDYLHEFSFIYQVKTEIRISLSCFKCKIHLIRSRNNFYQFSPTFLSISVRVVSTD